MNCKWDQARKIEKNKRKNKARSQTSQNLASEEGDEKPEKYLIFPY